MVKGIAKIFHARYKDQKTYRAYHPPVQLAKDETVYLEGHSYNTMKARYLSPCITLMSKSSKDYYFASCMLCTHNGANRTCICKTVYISFPIGNRDELNKAYRRQSELDRQGNRFCRHGRLQESPLLI
jgi:hypothetical protein